MTYGEYLGAGSAVTKGLWHLNGNSNDSSGNGQNGTDSSMSYVDGYFGECGRYTGSAPSRTVGNSNLGITGGLITMGCWFKVTNTAFGGGVLISQSSATNRVKFSILYNPTTQTIQFIRTKNFVGNDGPSINVNLNSGRHNLILTYDNTNVRGYVDGSLLGTAASSGNGSSSGRDGRGIGVLHREGSPQYDLYMQADIDECFIENRTWSGAEVQKYYTYAKGRFGIL